MPQILQGYTLQIWWTEQYKFQNNEWSQLLNLQVYLNLKDRSSVALWGLKLLTRQCTFWVWYHSHYCGLGRGEDLGPAVGLSEGYQTQTGLPSVLEEHYEKIWDELGVLISWDPWLHSNIIIFSPETKGVFLHCKLDSTFSWLLRWTISKGRERSRPPVLRKLEDTNMRISFIVSHLLMRLCPYFSFHRNQPTKNLQAASRIFVTCDCWTVVLFYGLLSCVTARKVVEFLYKTCFWI